MGQLVILNFCFATERSALSGRCVIRSFNSAKVRFIQQSPYCLEERIAEHIKTGELHIVLPDWSPIEPAMHLYYPGHRQVPQGLKELIEVLRSAYLDVA